MYERVKRLIEQYADGLITEKEAWVTFLTHIPNCETCQRLIE